MGAETHRQIAGKADWTLNESTGGILLAEQASAFIDLTVEQPTLLKDVTVDKMRAPKKLLEGAGFTTQILHASTAGTAFESGDRASLTLVKNELDVQPFRAVVRLTYDEIEDQIAGGNFLPWLEQRMAAAASVDMEMISVLSDVDTYTGVNDDLASFDGMLALATSHVVDNTGDPQLVTDDIFAAGLLEMPSKYLRDPANMRFYCSPTTIILYRQYLAKRGTPLGDAVMINGLPSAYYQGFPIYPLPNMPSDKYILTNRTNVHVGVWLNMALYVEDKPTEECRYYVLRTRFDCKYAQEDGVVKYDGISAVIGTA